MTHQPVNYLITARPHIILSQPGHIFQIRARPAQSRPVTHHVSHSSQDSPYQPVNYLITAKSLIPLYSRLSVKAQTSHPSLYLDLIFQSGQSMSNSQLCYHSKATHSTLEQTISESPVRAAHVNLLVILSEHVKCRLVTQSGTHFKPDHS